MTELNKWRKQNGLPLVFPRKKTKASTSPRPLTLSETQNMVIGGFDADVTKCGLAAYDSKTKKVLRFETAHLLDSEKWLNELIEEVGKERLYFRVELADTATVWGKVKKSFMMLLRSRARTLPKTLKGTFMRIFNSGKSMGMGLLFIEMLRRKGIKYEEVGSSRRTNIENKGLKAKSGLAILLHFKMRNRSFPSKCTASQVKEIFNITKGGNSESRDALMMAMPEVLYKLNKR